MCANKFRITHSLSRLLVLCIILYMFQAICNSFEYDFMLRFPTCQAFTTTTTTTTTTTRRPVKDYPQVISTNSAFYCGLAKKIKLIMGLGKGKGVNQTIVVVLKAFNHVGQVFDKLKTKLLLRSIFFFLSREEEAANRPAPPRLAPPTTMGRPGWCPPSAGWPSSWCRWRPSSWPQSSSWQLLPFCFFLSCVCVCVSEREPCVHKREKVLVNFACCFSH